MLLNRENIIDKIKKLMNLSENNPNEHEAIAAALKAQKLIAEYDIQQDELYGDHSQDVALLESPKFAGKQWRGYLATVVAENFRCKAVLSDSRDAEDNFKLRHVVIFIGYVQDAQAAMLVYEKLAATGEYLAKERCSWYRKQYGSAEGVKNTFLEGFISGVKLELEKQSQALILITPSKVIQVLETMKTFTSKFSLSQNIMFDDYVEGVSRGKDAVRSGRIESKNEKYLEG